VNRIFTTFLTRKRDAGRRLFDERADQSRGHASDYKPQEKDRYDDREYHSSWHLSDLIQVCEKRPEGGMAGSSQSSWAWRSSTLLAVQIEAPSAFAGWNERISAFFDLRLTGGSPCNPGADRLILGNETFDSPTLLGQQRKKQIPHTIRTKRGLVRDDN
jgi:hypothetical protein